MRRLLPFALALAAAGCAARSQRPSYATPDQPFRYQRPPLAPLDPPAVRGVRSATLPNGLRVIVAEDPSAADVSMRFINRRGGDDVELDRPATAAIATSALATSLARCDPPEGTECVDGPARYAVDHRAAHFSGDVEPGQVGVFVRRVAEGLRRYGVDRGDFESSTRRALNEAAEGRGGSLVSFVAPAVFADGTLFHSPIEGTPADVRYLRYDRVRDFVARRYAPSECALLAVGRTTLDEVMAYAERLLGPWQAAAPSDVPTARAELREGGDRVMLMETGNLPQATVIVAVPVRVADARALASVRLLATALASTFTSRIPRALRMERGSAYSVSASVSEFGDVALLWVESSIENARVGESLRLVLGEIAASSRTGVTAEEFETARRSTAARWQALLDSPEGVEAFLYDAYVSRRAAHDAPPEWLTALDGLTREEVNRLLAAGLSVGQARVFVRGDASALRDDLAALGLGRVATLSRDE